jgi:tetratricopeptide (TPR) repeat protein
MYLKTEKELYRTRRLKWGRVLMILLMIGAGIYVGYQVAGFINTEGTPFIQPTPVPTATPSSGYYISEAEGAYWEGRLTDAINAYQLSLDMEPNQMNTYVALARLMVFTGEAERALEMAREAMRRQPESAETWAIFCLIYDWLGLREDAVLYGEEAVTLDPTLAEAYAYLAEAYIDNGQWYAANDAIATALNLDDQSVDVLRGKGYVLENQGNYWGAIQAYQQALEIHDKLAYLYLAVGRNASVLGNYSMALQAFADATRVDPKSAIAFDQYGWTQLLLGDYDNAKENLTTAIDLNPDFSDALGHLGTLYFQQVNYEDAIAYLEPAIINGEALSRRKTVRFVITIEEPTQVRVQPTGPEVAIVEFIHPRTFTHPLRGNFRSTADDQSLLGHMRLDVLSGRYELILDNIPPVPAESVYIGWFLPLVTVDGKTVHTDALFPTPNGRLEFDGMTGPVKAQPIESYYILALSYYYLDDCAKAMPYIDIALSIDPNDENTLKTLELCQ